MTTKEKIKYYIDSKGISKNKFYTITGLSTSFLDSGNTIGVDKAKIIIEKFPDLSLEWLVLDRGPMLANNKVPEEKNYKKSSYNCGIRNFVHNIGSDDFLLGSVIKVILKG